MNTNNTVRDKAIEYVRQYTDKEIIWQDDPFPNNHLYCKRGAICEFAEHQKYVHVYLYPSSEHPQSKDTVPVQVEGLTGGWKVINWGQRAQIRDENNNEVCVILPNAMPFDAVIDNGIPSEETTATAQRIVTAVNNFDAMYAALKELLPFVENDICADLIGSDLSFAINKAKAILNTIDNNK